MTNRQVPVMEGDEIEVVIQSYGAKGDGIAKVEGYTIIIPDTEINRVYKVRITNVRRNYAFAEVVS